MLFHPKVAQTANLVKPLPPRTQAIVQITKGKVIATDKKQTRIVNIPKFGEIIVKVTDKGEVVLCSTGWMPQLGIRPYLGMAYTGKIEPLLGAQVVRIEPLQVGIGVDMTPSLIGVSLSRDLTQNSLVGIGTGLCSEMTQKYYVFFSLSF
jgi:hypothetical protein